MVTLLLTLLNNSMEVKVFIIFQQLTIKNVFRELQTLSVYQHVFADPDRIQRAKNFTDPVSTGVKYM